MRAAGLVLIALACACGEPIVPRVEAPPDRCAFARASLDAARELATKGRSDRAAAKARAAYGVCHSRETTITLANALVAIGRTDELAEWNAHIATNDPDRALVADALARANALTETVDAIVALADREAPASPARRALLDLALNRLEITEHATVHVQPIAAMIRPMSFSDHGRWATWGHTLIEAKTGRAIDLAPGTEITISADERWAISLGATTLIYDLDAPTSPPHDLRTAVADLKIDPSSRHAVFFIPCDAKKCAAGVVELATARVTKTNPVEPLSNVVFTTDGSRVAWSSANSVYAIDLASGVMREIAAKADAIAIGGDHLLHAGDGSFVVMRVSDGHEIFRAKTSAEPALSTDGARVVWSDEKRVSHVRDLLANRNIRVPDFSSAKGVCTKGDPLEWTSVDATSASGHRSCTLVDNIDVDLVKQTFHLTSVTPEAEDADLQRVCVAAKGAYCDQAIAVGSGVLARIGREVVILDRKTSQVRVRFAESEYVTSEDAEHAVMSANAKHMIASDGSGRARIWDLATGAIVWRSAPCAEPIDHVEFDKSGAKIFTGTPIGVIRRFDLATGALEATWTPACHDPRALAVREDDTAIFACGLGDEVRVYELGKPVPLLVCPASSSVVLDPLGRSIATRVPGESRIIVTALTPNGAAGEIVIDKSLIGRVNAFALSGDFLAASPGIVWNVRTHAEIARFRDDDAPTLADDGSWVVSRSANGLHAISLVSPAKPIELTTPVADVITVDAFGVVARVNDDTVGLWSYDAPSPRLVHASGIMETYGAKRIAASNARDGVVIAPLGEAATQTLLAVPMTESAVSIDAYGAAHFTGDAAGALVECVVGKVTLAFDRCRGRFIE